jgi:anti-anti-sigma regulatory factor
LSLKVTQDRVGVLDLLGIRSMIPTTVVRAGQKPKDFELQGDRLVVTRNLAAGDHVSLQVWCRRLVDVVSSTPLVDLTRIDEIDSRSMGVLTELWASCRQRGKRPVYEVSPKIHERLIDVNLDRVFEIKEIKNDSAS